MPHPTEARQLPGVKGQWILCSECPPTEADGDSEGEVRIYYPDPRAWGSEYRKVAAIHPSDHWCPDDRKDPRPFTLPAAPAPEQPATVKRKFVQLVCHPKGTAIYAVADDGTAWISSEDLPDWVEMGDLPNREVPNA